MFTDFKYGDPRRTLADEYRDRGLIRPNQRKKLSKDERDKLETVTFQWGGSTVRGYR